MTISGPKLFYVSFLLILICYSSLWRIPGVMLADRQGCDSKDGEQHRLARSHAGVDCAQLSQPRLYHSWWAKYEGGCCQETSYELYDLPNSVVVTACCLAIQVTDGPDTRGSVYPHGSGQMAFRSVCVLSSGHRDSLLTP